MFRYKTRYNSPMKTLYYGDNLEILRNKIPDNCIDLCYIDPPFNSKRSYFQIYNNIGGSEDKAQAQAFVDTWKWDTVAEQGYSEITTNFQGRFTRQAIELIKGLELVLKKGDLLAYLVHMTLRITEIYRVLKPAGSFYLHCDPTASHYLKLVLDAVFVSQKGQFRNEIAWCYRGAGYPKNDFGRRHDIIFRYSKSDTVTFNLDDIREPYAETTKSRFKHYIGNVRDGVDYGNQSLNPLGRHPDDWWQIQPIAPSAKERMGYPTQKPEALLERIIRASSNPGDVVLDAYCGCGTTVAVADRLDRQWIGIDITYHSIGLILKRLAGPNSDKPPADVVVDGIPQDIESARALANRDDDRVRKEFEKWAVLTYTNNRAVINEKKGADKGIDGVVYFASGPGKTERMVIQVKSGGADRGTIAKLGHDMLRERAELAILITMDEPTKPMISEAKSVGVYEHALMGRSYDRIRIVTVREMIEQDARIDLPLSYDAVKPGKKGSDDLQIRMNL